MYVLCRSTQRDGSPAATSATNAGLSTPVKGSVIAESTAGQEVHVADPFADESKHIGKEVMLFSELDLLDNNASFRLYFVDTIVKAVEIIRQGSVQNNGSEIVWDKFNCYEEQLDWL